MSKSGEEFDESEDEEIPVSYTSHLRPEDLDLRVDGFGRSVCSTSQEIIENGRGMVLESLYDRSEVRITRKRYDKEGNPPWYKVQLCIGRQLVYQ